MPVSTFTIENAFAEVFRSEAYRTIEYSLGPDPMKIGTMVGGTDGLIAVIRRFLDVSQLAGDWFWAVERFARLVRPDTYLFKTDWNQTRLESITIYCRFPQSVSQSELEQILSTCPPLHWSGPSMDDVSRLFEVAGPRGIGFRFGMSGSNGSALYFRVPLTFRQFRKEKLGPLMKLCGFDSSIAEEIAGEVAGLYRTGLLGVVGLDSADEGSHGTLKLDPANVPLRAIQSWLQDHEALSGYIQQIGRLASTLRAAFATYFGVKFDERGLSGWKVYFAVKPNELSPAGSTRVIGPRELSPALRTPQY